MGPNEIKHNAPTPPYAQLAAILRSRVERGDWRPGEPIASELRLTEEYGVSRGTVRRAIAVLVDEGVLFVVPHRGTYVAER